MIKKCMISCNLFNSKLLRDRTAFKIPCLSSAGSGFILNFSIAAVVFVSAVDPAVVAVIDVSAFFRTFTVLCLAVFLAAAILVAVRFLFAVDFDRTVFAVVSERILICSASVIALLVNTKREGAVCIGNRIICCFL